ncbi:MAG TPA: CaiB/BaiF CoA-transferase family protein [Candidatus Dormibacteraeota bacterium]|nr:CaiB/BaiF CoA-transferase family protein [Candidatus Dormibacteraeota bacterium]
MRHGQRTFPAPLAGVRVLDLSRLLPGGFLTALLADLGADVVKVEEPLQGDYSRWDQPRLGTESASSWVLNRNKRSLAVDLKQPQGVARFLRLAERAQVVVESFRPGVVDRLGVGYAAVAARNPAIVYASLSGYGSDGDMRDAAGHDINYIAYAGVLGMTGPAGGPPVPPGVQVGDVGGASVLGIGLLASLYRAALSGQGEHVEVAMYDVAMAWTSIHAGGAIAGGSRGEPAGMRLNGLLPCYGVYRCAGGGHISVGALEPKFWAAFCAGIGRPDLEARRNDPSARADVAAVVVLRTREEWVAEFAGRDACVAPVLDLAEALEHPLARQRHMVVDAEHPELGPTPNLGTPVRLGGAAAGPGRAPSRLGADTRDVIAELGVPESECASLRADGVVREASEAGAEAVAARR